MIEEKELVSLSWLIALSALDSPIAEDAAVIFRDVDHFNFNGEFPIKTTLFKSDSQTKDVTSTPSPSTARTANTSRSPVSILRLSCAKSIGSELTNDNLI